MFLLFYTLKRVTSVKMHTFPTSRDAGFCTLFFKSFFCFSSNIFERVLTALRKISSTNSVLSLHFSTRKKLGSGGDIRVPLFCILHSKVFHCTPNAHRVRYFITLKVYIANNYRLLHSFTRKLSLCHLSLFEWLWCLKKKKKYIIYW